MQTVYENMVPEFLIPVINEETVATSDSFMSCMNLATQQVNPNIPDLNIFVNCVQTNL